MTKASDNLFPKLLVVEGTAPSSPSSGDQALFIDSADHKLKRKNSSGTVTTIESAGSLEVKEIDGAPDVTGVTIIQVTNGKLTDNGGGDVTLDLSGGGGSFTHSYVGYNTIGGSNENVGGASLSYFKAFTPGSSGLLLSIGAYIAQTAGDNFISMMVGVNADNAGSPGALLAGSVTSNTGGSPPAYIFEKNNSGVGDAGWFHQPIGIYLTGSTQYWLQVILEGNGGTLKVYYDTSGSDQTNNNGGAKAVTDGRRYTLTNSTKKYSIRGDFIV